MNLRYVDNVSNQAISAYTTLDARLAWRPRDGLELSLVGQSLLDEQHPEFGTGAARREIQRGVYGKVSWKF